VTDTAADTRRGELPPDSHVHSQWSWDALAGSMEDTCRRAVGLGLPAVAFTEHADFTPWLVLPGEKFPDQWRRLVSGGVLAPPALDLDGYRDCLQRCRERFPGLRILSGVELSEPHWHSGRATALLGEGGFDRVLAAVHSAPLGTGFTVVSDLFRDQAPAEVVRGYLAETAELISRFDAFEVLAHIDYPVRRWPQDARPYDPREFEEEYRHVLATAASAGKVLEVSTKVPLHPQILTWWRQEGGQAITFGSDAHDPAALAAGFRDAAQMAEAAGFAPGRDLCGPWGRNAFPA
jgi:histidinol-phosphatase (PHP family)